VPADEVTHGADVEASRVRTGPRHAAPKKPLFTRFHVPAGKAIAMAAMPTAVLMGMGFTASLAIADSDSPSTPTSNSLTAEEYKDCVAALDDESASPSASADAADKDAEAKPTPSAGDQDSAGSSDSSGSSSSSDSGSGNSSSSDSGSGDEAEPTPSPSASKSSEAQSGDTATPSPSASESGGNLLEDIGDTITGIFTGGSGSDSTASPTPSASPSASEDTSSGSSDSSDSSGKDTSDTVKETTDKVTDTVKDTVKDTTDAASKAAGDTTKTVEKTAKDAADAATASPSPSASSSTDAENCPAATDDESGVDNKQPVADDPWYLEATSLTLNGADYQGVVEVKTANGTKKKVLKYVISDGTEIVDLHQIVKDKQAGKTYHVQSAKGETSTITGGKTVMYTESISGNLLGLIPLTFDPEHPPPLNLPWIRFTNVKVVQAGQFGGTLTVPGLHQYTTTG
jgi:gas vesicle protein